MNTSIIKNVLALLCLMAAIGLSSCKEDETKVIVIGEDPVNTTIDGYGTFLAVNKSTNDTLKQEGMTFVRPAVINAMTGDTINLSFTPYESYKNAKLEVTYTLHDQAIVKGEFEYDYILKDVPKGRYQLWWGVTYNGNPQTSITSDFVLNVN